MTLQKFIIAALVFFLLGIAILHSGLNRLPFRHGGSGHTSLVIDNRTAISFEHNG